MLLGRNRVNMQNAWHNGDGRKYKLIMAKQAFQGASEKHDGQSGGHIWKGGYIGITQA